MKLKNIVFMGTPEFAVPALELLSKTRFRPILCITQPDKPRGRKQKLQSPEIKTKALELEIPIIQPQDVNSADIISELKQLKPDIIITVAYGGYLKKEIRKLPEYGCINLHPSLLPKYRGAAPVNYTLFSGDKLTGNTIFKIVAKMDAGPVLYQRKVKIKENECYSSLYHRLSILGAEDILNVLESIEKDKTQLIKQDETQVTFSHKLTKDDLFVNWHQPAEKIWNKVRGLAEIPGAVASFRNERIKIIEVEIMDEPSDSISGTIAEVVKSRGIILTTLDKNILLKRVQPAGKKIMTSFAFSLGARIKKGEKFESGF